LADKVKIEIASENIKPEEIREAIDKLKLSKAVGLDFVCSEMLKYAESNILINVLANFYSAIFYTGIIPRGLNTSVITPIPKKDSMMLRPADFRPISVSSTFANILEF
jgi:hypothetical protein